MEINDSGLWQDTLDLLKLAQSDYKMARTQLDTISRSLAEREALTAERLRYALIMCGGYQTLCLVPVGEITGKNRMGKVVLGEVFPPSLPRDLRLTVRCFQRLEVCSRDEKLSRWQSANAKFLFTFFTTRHGEPVNRELIIETLWPECNLQAAGNNLKVAIHSLRKILNRIINQRDDFPSIIFIQGSYQFNPEIDVWIDVEQFERHWTEGRRLEKEGNQKDAVTEYQTAEALYIGDYLEDEPYSGWALLRRETLKDIYLIILGKLADYSMEMLDYESGIMYCQKIIAKDNCCEDAYRRLMRCYSRMGNRNRALRWYEICYQTIKTELDTTIDNKTLHLYEQLLNEKCI
ncbi:BTAD domain-containing putative transcriptional regulator [Chloroflexota bacterium]